MNTLRGLFAWLFSVVVLLGSTAAVGLGVAVINPGAALVAAFLTFFIVNLVLTEWLRKEKIEYAVFDRFGSEATLGQREAVSREVRAELMKQEQLAAHAMNQQRLRHQQQQQLQQQRDRANQIQQQARQRAAAHRPPMRGR